MADWKAAIRESLVDDWAAHGEGFSGWEHADAPELVGLERWGTELAAADRRAGVAALVLAAQAGFRRVAELGGDQLESMGFYASEASHDGAPVEAQLMAAAAWVTSESESTRQAVDEGFDRARQLYVWDDDLRPSDEVSFFWYLDVGQCACAAIRRTEGDAAEGGYYEWPPEACIGRGLVVAARGLRAPGTDLATILARFRDAFERADLRTE